MKKRNPTLYKHREKWYARIWDLDKQKYFSRSLGIAVEGKKGRRDEAMAAALKIAEVDNKQKINIADVLLLDYVGKFWKSDSEYVREKAELEKKPISTHYLLTNNMLVEKKIKKYPEFKN